MMAQRADAIIVSIEATLRHTRFEVLWFWEDMAYSHPPLIAPEVRRCAVPH